MKTSPKANSRAQMRARRSLARNKRSRVEMAGVMLVLLLTAVPAGWWGFKDFNEALTFPGRVTGAVLIVVWFITLAGAAAVLDHWLRGTIPYSGLFALISTGVAFLANLMLLLQAATDGERPVYPVLLGLLTVGSAWAAVVVWRTLVEIPAPKRVAMALVVSTVLAIANFSYQNLYQPYQRRAKPLLNLTVGKAVLNRDRKAFSLPVDIKIVNHSDMGFYVVGTEFHAMGERVPLSGRDRLYVQWRVDAENWSKYREKHPLSRREAYQPGELVAAQPWLPSGNWIEASDEYVVRTVVQLPLDTPYDHLAFYATASLARKDQIGLGRFNAIGYSWRGVKLPQWVKGDDAIVYRADIQENNAIDGYTRKPRSISVYWRFGAHGVDVLESIRRKGEEDSAPSEREDREAPSRYGLVDVQTGPIEQTLWDVKSRR